MPATRERVGRLALLAVLPAVAAVVAASVYLGFQLDGDRSRTAALARAATRGETIRNALGTVSTETTYLVAEGAFGRALPGALAPYAAGAESMRKALNAGQVTNLLVTVDRQGAGLLGTLDDTGVDPPGTVRSVLAPLRADTIERLRTGRRVTLDGNAYADAIGWLTLESGRAQTAAERARAALLAAGERDPLWRDPAFLGVLIGLLALALGFSLGTRRRLIALTGIADAERETHRQRTEQLDALLAVMRSVGDQPDVDSVAREIAGQAVVVAGAEFAIVAMAEPEGLVPIASAGEVETVAAPSGESTVGRVVETGLPHRAVVAREPILGAETGPFSIVGAPLVSNRRVVGAVAAGRRGEGLFDEDDETALQLLAAGAASALEAARLHGNASELAQIDSLTGLYNRRRLEVDLAAALEECEARHLPVSVAMVDIDLFKQLNDALGHLAGDEVLRAIASVLGACVRGRDRVYRYGGEEFAIVFPETHLTDALAVAERMRASVLIDSLSRAAEGDEPAPITVSIGVACSIATSRPEPAALIADADIALYEAKSTGRNRVVAASRKDAAG